jgi:YfiH family protein
LHPLCVYNVDTDSKNHVRLQVFGMAFYPTYGNKFLALKSTLFPEWELVHGFGTRVRFGDVTGPDRPEEAWLRELSPAAPAVGFLRQVHSATGWIVSHREGRLAYRSPATPPETVHQPPEGDALLTADRAVGLAVRTADCFPLILFDPRRQVTAVIHSGWRGTLDGITARTIHHLAGLFGTDPTDLRAAVGPGIQGCCYEVDESLADRFAAAFPGSAQPRPQVPGKYLLDIALCLRQSLRDAGVDAGHQDFCPLCTACNPLLFHSWRRDGPQAGRMISLALLPN